VEDAVDFDNKLSRRSEEVDDKVTDHDLSPEGDAETLPSNLSPELLLGGRGRGEHLARAGEEKGFTASSGAIEVVRHESLSERGEGGRS
jgi:hypothetical protein